MTAPTPTPPAPPAEHSLVRSEERFQLLVESVQDYAIFMLDPEGYVMTWNIGAEKIKGWQAQEIIGQSFEVFYPPEAIASGWPREELRRATRDGRIEDQGWRVRKDGERIWANVVITALRDEDGRIRGFAKVTRDLTETRRQQEALRQSEELLRLLVESVNDYAIFMLDPQGHILTWNAGAALLHGHPAAEVIGEHFSRFFMPEDRLAGRPEKALARALADGRAEEQGWRMSKDGSVFWADVIITRVLDAQGQLRGFAKVTRDLSEQRRIDELERASQRMSEFLAMLGHELRNPLAPIRNAVSILQLQPELPPALCRSRDILARQMGQLNRLVDDLLDVGRIVTGKILLEAESIDFLDVVHASVEATMPLIEARRHRLAVDLPPAPLRMVADATRLIQALQNLLNNAARYTPDGGDIRLQVRVEESAAITTVTDSGPGIAPEALERIFELFVQEDASRVPHERGLGIGLTLARTLAEQHGGMLAAASQGPGSGSTFTLRLPLRNDGERPATGTARSSSPSQMRRVLVIDDNQDSADSMVEVLQILGHDALGAYSGDEAVQLALDFLPDVALLDLNMPGGDGFSVLRRLRVQPALTHLRVAAMTGYGQKSDHERTQAAGFDAHLTKPVDMHQLEALLEHTDRSEAPPPATR